MTFPPTSAPKSLKELFDEDQSAYKLAPGYYIELVHSLAGFFPAVYEQSGFTLVSTDPVVIHDAWEKLTPRASRVVSLLFYVNDELKVGYPISKRDIEMDSDEWSRPMPLLTAELLKSLSDGFTPPFKWRPGLMGPKMEREEFLEMINQARADMNLLVAATV
jgi:hypothetical protein